MWPTSAGYQTAVATSHQVAWRLETLYSGVVTGTFDDSMTGGAVSVAKDAPIRRTVRLQVMDRDGTLGPLIGVYGQEVRPYRGIVVSGAAEYVPLGTFWITRASNPDADGVVWNLEGFDRGGVIAARRFHEAYQIALGTNYGLAIQNLLIAKMPTLVFNPPSFASLTARTTPSLALEAQADPWEAAIDMAHSIGMQLYFDPLGVATMAPEPNPIGANIVRTYADPETGVTGYPLLYIESQLTNQPLVPNGAVVTGESTGLAMPVRGSAWDTDGSSPTYRYGAYGEVPRFAFNPLMTTTAQATEAATAELQAVIGSTEQIVFDVLPDAAHSESDVIRLVGGTVDNVFVLEQFTVPLEVEAPMRAQVRKRRSA